jgi:hypothetical protein
MQTPLTLRFIISMTYPCRKGQWASMHMEHMHRLSAHAPAVMVSVTAPIQCKLVSAIFEPVIGLCGFVTPIPLRP